MVRRLPSATGCDADLVVLPSPLDVPGGGVCVGSFHPGQNTIAVALLPNPYETIGTLLHEVAHFAANPRHKRHHGYSWRWQYRGLAEDLLGRGKLLPLASYRRQCHADLGRWFSRQGALDVLVVVALTEARAHVQISPEQVTAVVGRRRLRARVQIPH